MSRVRFVARLATCAVVLAVLQAFGAEAAALAAPKAMAATPAAPATAQGAVSDKSIHRLAFIVSANNGGRARIPLRYAGKDAQIIRDGAGGSRRCEFGRRHHGRERDPALR